MSPEAVAAVLGGILVAFALLSWWRNRRLKHRNEINPETGGSSLPGEAPAVPRKRGSWDNDPSGSNDSGGDGGGGGD